MKERPILFSAPMVRAILSGTKTQTRRILKQAVGPSLSVDCEDGVAELSRLYGDGPGHEVHENLQRINCPYGKTGDRLWVRETWAEVARAIPSTDEDLPMRSDGRILVYRADPEWNGARQFASADGCLRWANPSVWRPSIHMPRWASRIDLEVTGVCVERLQDISEEDAVAEGIERAHVDSLKRQHWKMYDHKDGDPGPGGEVVTYVGPTHTLHPIESYKSLWLSINGPGSWDANPWVWVVEFRRIGHADQA